MTRRMVFGLVVPLLLVLHFLLHVGFSIGGWAPDLLTLALLLAAREIGMGAGGVLGFFFGILEDAFSVLAFGASALAMACIGILGARTRDLFVGDSVLFLFAYLFFGKFLRDLIYWVVAGASVRGPFVSAVLVDGGVGAIYLAVVGLLFVGIFGGNRTSP